MRVDAFLETFASIHEVQPGLAAGLPGLEVPFTFVHGGSSPMPTLESSASVDLLPNAELEVVEGAGHFIWHERPGAVRAALDRLAARTSKLTPAGAVGARAGPATGGCEPPHRLPECAALAFST